MNDPSKTLPASTFVDAHFHVFDAGQAQGVARYVPAYDAALSQWQAVAQPVGVQRGVLVQPSFLGTDNSRLLAELRAHPQRLRGVAVVAPETAAPEIAQLHEAGVRGIRINLAGQPHTMAAWAAAHALWDALLATGWHVELHTDNGALPAVLAQLPQGLPLVIDHMGKPLSESCTDHSIRHLVQRARQAPAYVKLSGAYRLGGLDAKALARCWADELGPDYLLWGSDWPCTNHESCADYPALLQSLFEWVGSDRAKAALVDNPNRLYLT